MQFEIDKLKFETMIKYLVQNFPIFKIMKILNAKEKERCKIEKNEEKKRSRRKMNRIRKSNIVKTDGKK